MFLNGLQVALKDRPGCSMQGPCLPRNVWPPAPSHHQVPPLTLRLAPSWSAPFCPCPGFHPLIMLQADESHCSPQRSPTERCWLFSFEHWLHDRNGQVKQSHSSEETTLQMHQLDTAFGATPDVRAIRRQSSSPVQAAAAWYVRQVALRECLEASKTSSRGCFTPAICI